MIKFSAIAKAQPQQTKSLPRSALAQTKFSQFGKFQPKTLAKKKGKLKIIF
jgi:hypothetical protein